MSFRSGISSARTRLRRWTGSALVGSVKGSRPSARHTASVSLRRRSRMGWPLAAHAGQAVEAGAPQEVEQDGLGLVVGGVAGEDVGGQHGVAGGPGPGLEVGAGGDVDRLGPEAGAEPGRGGLDAAVGLGLRAQAVVDVDGGDLAAGGDGQDQQGQGVGAAGDGAGDGVPAGGNVQRASSPAITPAGRWPRRLVRASAGGRGSRPGRAGTPGPARGARCPRRRPPPGSRGTSRPPGTA